MHPRSFFSSAVALLIALLLLGPASRAATVTVQAPAPVICVHGSTGGTLASFSGTRVVTWDDADVVVRCEGDGVEPRDLSAADSSVTIAAARDVVVRLPEPQAIVLEWIAIENDEPRVLASRSLETSKEMTVPVAKDHRRWLRVRRSNFSPMTLAVPPGENASLDVPKALVGGEIFGRIPRGEFMPQSMTTFPETRTAAVADRFFALHGIRPGAFTLRAIYVGGIARHISERVVAKDEESAWIDIERLRPVGAIRAEVSEELCRSDGTLLLITTDGVLAESKLDPEGCNYTWEGIPTESVTVRFRHPLEGAVASVSVEVAADRYEDVKLTRNTPLVRGRVLIGGKLAPEARIRFQREEDTVDVVAGLDARYEARLPIAGEWLVGPFFTAFAGFRGEPHEFAPGEQEFDVELPGGRIVVHIRTEGAIDKRGFAQFYLRGTKSAATIVRLDGPIEIAGLPFGPYTVEASVPDVGLSNPVAIELTDQEPTAEVTLDILSSDIFFHVLDPGGLPVRGARVSAGGKTFAENAPGRFLLNEVRDGALAKVRAPGYEALCAAARAPRTSVTLRPAGAQTAHFRTERDAGFAIRGFLGSDCWFVQGDVEWRYVPGGFEITGLNPGRYTLSVAGKRFEFDVPGPVVDLDVP